VKLLARVPATSANLGPGFDCLGLALALHNEVVLDTGARPGVSWEGEGAEELPTDGSDMVSLAMAHVARQAGSDLPAFHLHGTNRVPLERGLGSSAAAAVAGVMLAAELLELGLTGEGGDPHALLVEATSIEGHPDNAAPAIYGGFTIADGEAPPIRLDPHPDLCPIALIPRDVRLPTSEARRALRQEVPLADAVFNLRRAAQAVIAFTRDPEMLGWALEDRLHQDVRLALVPTVREAFDRLKKQGIPVCVSGAGPTLLAFDRSGVTLPDLGPGWEVVPLDPEPNGALVSPVR
jgi:homoserine kinase